jgi:hypothetical protein
MPPLTEGAVELGDDIAQLMEEVDALGLMMSHVSMGVKDDSVLMEEALLIWHLRRMVNIRLNEGRAKEARELLLLAKRCLEKIRDDFQMPPMPIMPLPEFPEEVKKPPPLEGAAFLIRGYIISFKK